MLSVFPRMWIKKLRAYEHCYLFMWCRYIKESTTNRDTVFSACIFNNYQYIKVWKFLLQNVYMYLYAALLQHIRSQNIFLWFVLSSLFKISNVYSMCISYQLVFNARFVQGLNKWYARRQSNIILLYYTYQGFAIHL